MEPQLSWYLALSAVLFTRRVRDEEVAKVGPSQVSDRPGSQQPATGESQGAVPSYHL